MKGEREKEKVIFRVSVVCFVLRFSLVSFASGKQTVAEREQTCPRAQLIAVSLQFSHSIMDTQPNNQQVMLNREHGL